MGKFFEKEGEVYFEGTGEEIKKVNLMLDEIENEDCNHDWHKLNDTPFKGVDTGDGIPTHHCNNCGELGMLEGIGEN